MHHVFASMSFRPELCLKLPLAALFLLLLLFRFFSHFVRHVSTAFCFWDKTRGRTCARRGDSSPSTAKRMSIQRMREAGLERMLSTSSSKSWFLEGPDVFLHPKCNKKICRSSIGISCTRRPRWVDPRGYQTWVKHPESFHLFVLIIQMPGFNNYTFPLSME